MLQARLGGIVPLRVAIETGEVIAGGLGLTGPPVSLAMELLSGAGSGDVLLGARASAVHARRQPGPGRERLAPLVGRGAELDALRVEYRRVRADAGARLVTIVGDAGVGKSRLARKFVAGLSAESPTPYAVAGSCISYGHALAYRALGDVLREILGVHESDSRDTILETRRVRRDTPRHDCHLVRRLATRSLSARRRRTRPALATSRDGRCAGRESAFRGLLDM